MRLRSSLCLALGLALSLGVAGAATADLAKWDQARVTTIAKQLKDQTEKAYTAVYREAPLGMGRSVPSSDMKHSLRRIHEEAVALDGHLKKGEGHDQTVGIWKHMMELVRDLDVDARESFLPNDVTAALAKVEDLLGQLQPYYDPKSTSPGG